MSIFESIESVDRAVLIRIREGDFNKLLQSRMVKNKIYLHITCKVDYEQYLHIDDYYRLQMCGRYPDTPMLGLDGTDTVSLTEEEMSTIVTKNRYTEWILLEIPLKDESSNSDLTEAMKGLRLAAEGFKEGNYYQILINARNAVFNHLTEKIQGSISQVRILKSDIVNSCLSKCPEYDRKIYTEILKEMGAVIVSLVNILSQFIHKDQDKIIKIPLENDLEVIYFSIALIVRYLSRLTVHYR
jgi:hypothetical protein